MYLSEYNTVTQFTEHVKQHVLAALKRVELVLWTPRFFLDSTLFCFDSTFRLDSAAATSTVAAMTAALYCIGPFSVLVRIHIDTSTSLGIYVQVYNWKWSPSLAIGITVQLATTHYGLHIAIFSGNDSLL